MNRVLQLRLALSQLRARKGRSLLTMLGIIIGVAGVIIIISLGAGAQQLVLGQITKLGTNLVGVLPGKSDDTGPPAAVFGVQITTLSLADVSALKDTARVPNATAVAPFVRGSGTVIWRDQNISTSFTGTTSDYPRVQNTPMALGSFFSDQESQSNAQVVVLGYAIYQSLFQNGEDPVGQIVKIGNLQFRVVGVVAKLGTVFFQNQDDQVFIPIEIAQHQLLGINYIQFIRIKVSSDSFLASTMQDVITVLREEHHIRHAPEDDDFSVRNLADAIKILTSITDALRGFLAIMASIALVVGGIGIMNIMLVTVSERTREVGLRKAVGATRAAIRNQFLFEACVLTLAGGVLGILVGSIISFLISLGAQFAGFDWKFVISPVAIVLAVSVSTATGIIFGLYPALKASKLDPIVALRRE